MTEQREPGSQHPAANTPRTALELLADIEENVKGLAAINDELYRRLREAEAAAAAPTPAERREALRELSRDADDLGIYVEPLTSSKDAPATAAGRRFLAEGEDCWFDWTGMAGDVVDAVLAIEADAFMEGARASRENRVAIEAEAAAAAPTPAEPLDVERLARAIWGGLAWADAVQIHADSPKELADIAQSVADEYARLAASPSPEPEGK